MLQRANACWGQVAGTTVPFMSWQVMLCVGTCAWSANSPGIGTGIALANLLASFGYGAAVRQTSLYLPGCHHLELHLQLHHHHHAEGAQCG